MPGTDARMRVSSVIVAGVVLRHVEVGADEDPLAAEIEVGHAENGHRCRRRYAVQAGALAGAVAAVTNATVVSSIRLEKPHSLSYQATP